MNKYKIYYKVWDSGHGAKYLESPVFEYPNNMHIGERIQIQLDKFCWSKEVFEVWHSIPEGHACLYVKEPTSHERSLEQMINEAQEAFDKLNKSSGGK